MSTSFEKLFTKKATLNANNVLTFQSDSDESADTIDSLTRLFVIEELFHDAVSAYLDNHPELLVMLRSQVATVNESMDEEPTKKKMKLDSVPPKTR